MELFLKQLDPRAKLPTRAYNSAGYDLYPMKSGKIGPGQQDQIHLGFCSEFSPDYAAVIDDRSSTGFIGVSHMAGVIDADYRGEWIVTLRNHGGQWFYYSPKKAIAQVLFLPIAKPVIERWYEHLTPSARARGMTGSSDNRGATKNLDLTTNLGVTQRT